MDGDRIGWLAAWIILLIVGAGCFSAFEMSFASLNKMRIKSKADGGDAQAKRVMFVTEHFDKALVTILIANNLMNIACASLTAMLASQLWGVGYVAYAVVAITVVVIFFSEMLPKSLGKNFSESIAMNSAGLLIFFMKLLAPFSYLLERIGRFASELLALPLQPTATEEELVDIIKTIEDEGTIDEDQSELLQSAVEFNATTVENIYTPMDKVTGLDLRMSQEEVLKVIREEKYSRYPVYDNGRIVGILQARQFLKNCVAEYKRSFRSLLTGVYYISKDHLIDDLLSDMSRRKVHMGIVIDSQRQLIGIVTMEDILEELVGEIWDESDEVLDYFMELGGNRYEVDGDLPVSRAFALIHYPCDSAKFHGMTMMDWAKQELTLKIEEDDEFSYEDLSIKISEMQNGVIRKMTIKVNGGNGHE